MNDVKKPSRIQRQWPWLKSYSGSTFADDFVAAIIVTVLLVPQCLAYAMLADLPPVVGIYASIFPLLAYAAFGLTGKQRTGCLSPIAPRRPCWSLNAIPHLTQQRTEHERLSALSPRKTRRLPNLQTLWSARALSFSLGENSSGRPTVTDALEVAPSARLGKDCTNDLRLEQQSSTKTTSTI